jgi:hypothetical protein
MDTIKMLVNARSEFIWGIKFGNYQVFILLFYYLFILSTIYPSKLYTICSYPKTWYFSHLRSL